MSLLKKELDRIWNRPGVAFPLHRTKWSGLLEPYKGKLTIPRTEGQLIMVATTKLKRLYKPHWKWLGIWRCHGKT